MFDGVIVGNNPVMGVDPLGLCKESSFHQIQKGLEFGFRAAGVIVMDTAIDIVKQRAIDWATGKTLDTLKLSKSGKLVIDYTIDKSRKTNDVINGIVGEGYKKKAEQINQDILDIRKEVYGE